MNLDLLLLTKLLRRADIIGGANLVYCKIATLI